MIAHIKVVLKHLQPIRLPLSADEFICAWGMHLNLVSLSRLTLAFTFGRIPLCLPCARSNGPGYVGGLNLSSLCHHLHILHQQYMWKLFLAPHVGFTYWSEVAQSCPTLAIPWTVACQAPLSMGFSRQEYWSGLPFPSLGCLPNPGIKPVSPALAGGFFTTVSPGNPLALGIKYWLDN